MTTTTGEQVGHWTVNGQDFCQTSYEAKLPHPDDVNNSVYMYCACTEAEYNVMSRALKLAHPDGSASWVACTAWYPTRCSRGKRDIQSTQRTYVDMALFQRALNEHGISYDVNETPSFDHRPIKLTLSHSQYTMNPHGYHIGYEEYEATLIAVEARAGERNAMHIAIDEASRYLVDIDSLDIKIVSHPDIEECDGVNDDETGTCEDDWACELYTGPDEDFAYDTMYELVRATMETPIEWKFDRENNTWMMHNYATGEILLPEAD